MGKFIPLNMDFTSVLGWVATFLFSVMTIPQMMKTIKTKDTRGVSLLLFIIFLIANIIALTYAILISQPPLIIKYILAILTTILYIGLYAYYYRQKKKEGVGGEKIEGEQGTNS